MNGRLILTQLICLTFIFQSSTCWAQCPLAITHSKISETRGLFSGLLSPADRFGTSASIGDLDGDGSGDLAVGAPLDDDGASNSGAIWILFLDQYGRTKSEQKISASAGNFTLPLFSNDQFGYSLTDIGDLNGDGTNEIAVGAPNVDDGGVDRGAVFILFMNQNGTVKSSFKISDTQGGFIASLRNNDHFGSNLSMIGDLNNDGFLEIAVGTPGDDDGGTDRGAVWILSLDSTGLVHHQQKISDTVGNFTGGLTNGDLFGHANVISDVNGDGIADLAVGAPDDDDGGSDKGAVWIVFLDTNGTVKGQQKISATAGGFSGVISSGSHFGSDICRIQDLNSDGIDEIVVGNASDDDGGIDRGAIWVLYLNSTGGVSSFQKISDLAGNFLGMLDNADNFGLNLSYMHDFNGDGFIDIAVSAEGDDDGGSDQGAVWILSLGFCNPSCGSGPQSTYEKIYRGFGDDIGHTIIRARDGNYLISGTTTSSGSGDFLVMKVTPAGDTVWTKAYGSTGAEDGWSVVIKPAADSGYIVIGRTFGFGVVTSGGYIIKINEDGDLIWQKVVDGNSNEHLRSIYITEDKGFIACGTNGYILKFDSLGNMQWNKYYSGGGNMHFTSIIQVENKFEYFAVGESTSYGSGGRSGYMTYLDSSGNKIWERVFDQTGQDALNTVIETPDGDFLVGGLSALTSSLTSSQLWLMKLDSIGQMVWSRRYSSALAYERAVKIKLLPSEEFLVSFYSENNPGYRNGIMQIDKFGNVKWSRIYPGNSSNIDTWWGEGIEFTDDEGYMFVNYGIFNIPPAPSTGRDVYLIKTDACGKTACSDLDINFTSEERIYNVITPNSSVVAHGTVTTVNDPAKNLDLPDSLICEYDPLCQLSAKFSFDTICAGDTMHFIDLSTDSLANVTGWQWTFGDGDSLWNTQQVNHLYTDSGTFNVRLVVFNDDTTFCSDTIEQAVLVLERPNPHLGNDTTLCYGDSITLYAGPSRFNYTWSDFSVDDSLVADTTDLIWVLAMNGACIATDTVAINFQLPPVADFTVDTVCAGDTTKFVDLSTNTAGNISDWRWYYGNGDSTWNVQNPSHFYSNFGIFNAKLVVLGTDVITCSDTLVKQVTVIEVPNPSLGPDTTICLGDGIQLNPGTAFSNLWSDASTGPTLFVDTAGLYWVKVANLFCETSDSILVNTENPPEFELGPDTMICIGETATFNAASLGATYEWNTNATDSFITVSSSGTYWVKVSKPPCFTFDTVVLQILPYPTLDLKESYRICENDTATVLIEDDTAQYVWSTGSQSKFTRISQEGRYWVNMAYGPCAISDTFNVRFGISPDTISKIKYEICLTEFVELDAENPGATYTWSTGAKTQKISTTIPGLYRVLVTTVDSCEMETTMLVTECAKPFIIPNTITPNDDGKNDTWIIENINNYPGNHVMIFNPNGQLIFETTGYQNDWDGTYNGRLLPATSYFYVLDLNNGNPVFKGTITVIRN